MEWTQEKLEDTFNELVELAKTDETLKAELLSDAKSAIENYAGTTLPEGCVVQVVENGQLSDEELQGVAGGVTADSVDCFIKCGAFSLCICN